jgi:hypothetical protein
MKTDIKDKTPKCPNCRAKLEIITAAEVDANYELMFIQNHGKYIPRIAISSAGEFCCSACSATLSDKWINEKTDRHVVSVKVSRFHKAAIIDLQKPQLNVTYAESFTRKIPKTLKPHKTGNAKVKAKEEKASNRS